MSRPLVLLHLLCLYPFLHGQNTVNMNCANGCPIFGVNRTCSGYELCQLKVVLITDSSSICEVACTKGKLMMWINSVWTNFESTNLAVCSGGSWCSHDFGVYGTVGDIACDESEVPYPVKRDAAFTGCPYDPTGPVGYASGTPMTLGTTCSITDAAAECEDDESLPICSCSSGYTDTFCGVALAKLKNLETIVGNGTDATVVLDMITDSKKGTAKFNANLPALLSFLTDEQRSEMSYSLRDTVVDATFEGRRLDIENDFTAFNDPSLGNCFTFNHINATNKYNLRNIGERGGLRVLLNAQSDEYVPWVDTVGVNVYVHPIGIGLFVESFKYTSKVGGEDELVLEKSTFTRLGNCAKSAKDAQSFYFDGLYTVDGCYRSCYQDSAFRSCGCMDPSYYRAPGVESCKLQQLNCLGEMMAARGDPFYWPEGKCPQPCQEAEYRMSASRVAYDMEMVCLDTPGSNISYTCDALTSTVLVSFQSLQIQVQEEMLKYSLSRLFGMTGSFASLLVGASIVFFFEVLVFLCHFGLASRAKKEERKRP